MNKKIITTDQTQDPRFRDVYNSWKNLDTTSKEILHKAVSVDREQKNFPNPWNVVITHALNFNNTKTIIGLFIASLLITPLTKNLVDHNFVFSFLVLSVLNLSCLVILRLLRATNQIRSNLIYSAVALSLIIAIIRIIIPLITKKPFFLLLMVEAISLNIVLILFVVLSIHIVIQLKK